MVSGQLSPRKIAPWLGLGFGLGLGLKGLGAIFLGGNCPRTILYINKESRTLVNYFKLLLNLQTFAPNQNWFFGSVMWLDLKVS